MYDISILFAIRNGRGSHYTLCTALSCVQSSVGSRESRQPSRGETVWIQRSAGSPLRPPCSELRLRVSAAPPRASRRTLPRSGARRRRSRFFGVLHHSARTHATAVARPPNQPPSPAPRSLPVTSQSGRPGPSRSSGSLPPTPTYPAHISSLVPPAKCRCWPAI